MGASNSSENANQTTLYQQSGAIDPTVTPLSVAQGTLYQKLAANPEVFVKSDDGESVNFRRLAFIDEVPGGSGSMTFKNDWNNAEPYLPNQMVNFNGVLYVSLTSNTNSEPDDNPSDWAPSFTYTPPVGNPNTWAGFDNSSVLGSIDSFGVDTTSGGMTFDKTFEPDGSSGGFQIHRQNINFNPTVNSENQTWVQFSNQINIDTDNAGFDFGTNGTAVNFESYFLNHQGLSDIGAIEFLRNNFSIGNGTDPISSRGIAYAFGLGQIAANVTVHDGAIQGYGFQLNVHEDAIIEDTVNIYGFYDFSNFGCEVPGHASFQATPNIFAIANNRNYNGMVIGPTIDEFHGNAGFNGLAISGNYGTFETGSWNAINVNGNVDGVNYASGITVNMDNVTVFPGSIASLIIQDLTVSMNTPSAFGNSITFEYVNDGTAGSETVDFNGGEHFVVHMQAGVSTALQIKAALEANITFAGNAVAVVSGTGSNTQTAFPETNLAGGSDPGQKYAGDFVGDVRIDGSLSFNGGLSIGALNSFAQVDIDDFVTGVNSASTLITSPSLAANLTHANSDFLGINTAMLLTLGDNASVTSQFLGYTALGLPAVVSMGTGSTIDQVAGATFAISLDAGAGGGTIDSVDLCRAIAIPNAATTVNKLKGFTFDLPFGTGLLTEIFGLYINSTDADNWLAKNLLIGGSDASTGAFALEVRGDADFTGDIAAATLTPANGATGSFTAGANTVTVTNGIITNIA